MSTSTTAVPTSLWAFLAELAHCANQKSVIGHAPQLAQMIADALRTHLAPAWGLVALQHGIARPIITHWGMDEAQVQLLSSRVAQSGLAYPEAVEFRLMADTQSTGYVIVAQPADAGWPDDVTAGIKAQLEVLLNAHHRELTARSDDFEEQSYTQLQQLTALQRISRELTATLYLHDTLGFALNEAIRATRSTQGFIALRGYLATREGTLEDDMPGKGYFGLVQQTDDPQVRIIAVGGVPDGQSSAFINRVLRAHTLADMAMAQGQPIVRGDLIGDERLQMADGAPRSALAVPIYHEAQVIGVITLYSDRARAYNQHATEFVRALSDQAALAIGNAQRYAEQRRQREVMLQRTSMLSEMLNIGQALRADNSLEDVLEQIAFSVVESTGYRSAVFNLIDSMQPTAMRTVTGAGLPLQALERLRQTRYELSLVEQMLDERFRIGRCFFVPSTTTTEIIERNQYDVDSALVILDDAEPEPDEFSLTNHATLWHPEDLLLVPLYSTRGRLIGVMSVDNPYDRQRPTARTVEPIEIFADQAAIAIENSTLLREARTQAEQMTAMYRVSSAATATLGLQDLLEGMYGEIAAYLGVPSFFFIASHLTRQGKLRFELFKQRGETLHAYTGQEIPVSGLARLVIESGEVQYFSDLETHRPSILSDMDMRVRSWVGIPLRSHNEVIGVLSVQDTRPHRFTERQITFLNTIGNQLAVSMENARLFSERERRIIELDAINQIGAITNSTFDLTQVLTAVCTVLGEVMPIDSFHIYVAHAGLNDESMVYELDEGRYGWRYGDTVGEGSLTERILRHGRPILVTDLVEQRESLGLLPVPFGNTSRRSRSWLGVPLLAGDQDAIGVMAIMNYTAELYDERDLDFLSTVARQIALCAQNARLFNESRRKVGELSTLLESSRVLSSSLKTQDVLHALLQMIARQLNIANVALWMVDGATLVPLATTAEQANENTPLLRVGEGLIGGVAQSRQPVMVSELYNHPDAPHGVSRTASFLGVPVVNRDRTLGVVSLISDAHRIFSADEIRLVAGIADQAAISLQNARLFNDRERRINELTTINRISQGINATLKLDEMLMTLHKGISEVMDTSTSFIALYQPDDDIITFPVFYTRGVFSPVSGSRAGEEHVRLSTMVLAERQPLLLTSLEAVREHVPKADIATWLGVPIVQGDMPLGLFCVQSYEPNAFDQENLRFLTTVASQAATAIANARLFSERERRLREVSAVRDIGSAVTSTLNLSDVLERLHRELGRVIDVSTSFIALFDNDSRQLSFPIAYDNGTAVELSDSIIDDPEQFGLTGWVMVHRQPLLVGTEEVAQVYRSPMLSPDALQEARVGDADRVEQSYLVVPIVSNELVLGIISIQSYERYAFSQEDLRFVTTVANQAAIAITNASLFQERGRRIQELATFNEIGQELAAASRIEELTELIYRQTSRLLNTAHFYVALYDERQDDVQFALFYADGVRTNVSRLRNRRSLTHHVARTRTPLLVQGPHQHELMDRLGISPSGRRSRSWLGVPMLAFDRVIGVIGIQDYEHENAYSNDDVRLLETIASWGAISLYNARLFSETQQSLQDRESLYDLSRSLAGTLQGQEVARITAASTLDLMRCHTSAVILFDRKRAIVEQAIIESDGIESVSELPRAMHLLLEELLESSRPVVVNDLLSRQKASGLFEKGGMRSGAGVLIGSPEQPLGAVIVSRRTAHDWTEREVSLLSIISNLSAQAIESARLFRIEEMRRMAADTLRNTAQKLTNLMPVEEVMSLILDQLAQLVPYESASLMMRSGDDIVMAAIRGFDEETRAGLMNLRFRLADDEHMRIIVETRRPLVLDDASSSPHYITVEGQMPIRGWIGAPLLLDDNVIGIITVDSFSVGQYTEEDANLAFTLASHAAQAVRNAQLFEQQQQFTEQLEARVQERTAELALANERIVAEKERLQDVHTITSQLTASLELDETLPLTLERVARIVDAHRGSIVLYDEKERKLMCRAVLRDDEAILVDDQSLAFEQGPALVDWVMRQRQPVCVPDVRVDSRWVRSPGRADEVRSYVAVPLMTNDGPIGVLSLSSPEVNFFSQEQMLLLATIANEVAIFIHNAQLYSIINQLLSQQGEILDQQREEANKNRAILQSLGEGVIVLDEQRRVVLFNPAAEQMLNISAAFVQARALAEIKHLGEDDLASRRLGSLYEGFELALDAVEQQGKPHNRILELPAPNQSISMNVSPVLGWRDAVSVIVLRDITREIESDRAKRDFISTVSHELRTPLTSIKGYVDLLMFGTAGPISEGQKSFLGVVRNNTRRLMELIDDILEIGRIDSNKIELSIGEVEVPNVLYDVVQTLQAEIDRKSLQVRVDIQRDVPKIHADQRRFTQVVLNMLSNAVKYTFPGGTIGLLAYMNPSGMLEIDVEDSGVGISPEDQKNLFRRFSRIDNPLRDEAGGTGLGLSIAKSFVELHGGEMWVRSELGKGSTFSFIVPVTQPERPKPATT